MIRKISNCVDCQLPCLYTSCPYYEVETAVCDQCGFRAEYRINGLDYCDTCAQEVLMDVSRNLTIKEKAKALDMDITEYING